MGQGVHVQEYWKLFGGLLNKMLLEMCFGECNNVQIHFIYCGPCGWGAEATDLPNMIWLNFLEICLVQMCDTVLPLYVLCSRLWVRGAILQISKTYLAADAPGPLFICQFWTAWVVVRYLKDDAPSFAMVLLNWRLLRMRLWPRRQPLDAKSSCWWKLRIWVSRVAFSLIQTNCAGFGVKCF